MPDVNYVITIKNESNGGGQVSNGVAPAMNFTEPPEDTKVRVPGVLKRLAPAAIAMQIGRTIVNGELNRVELRTGYSTLQERLNFAVTNGTRLLTSVMAGAAFGPVGAIAGGAVYMLSTGLSIWQSQLNIDINRSIEDINIGMANVRAGAGGDRSGQR